MSHVRLSPTWFVEMTIITGRTLAMPKSKVSECNTKAFVRVPEADQAEVVEAAQAVLVDAKAKKNAKRIAKSIQQNAV